jgi:hypothetical protein
MADMFGYKRKLKRVRSAHTSLANYRVFRAQADSTFHFTVEISCERTAPPSEKNFAPRHHLLRGLLSLHNEHSVFQDAQ